MNAGKYTIKGGFKCSDANKIEDNIKDLEGRYVLGAALFMQPCYVLNTRSVANPPSPHYAWCLLKQVDSSSGVLTLEIVQIIKTVLQKEESVLLDSPNSHLNHTHLDKVEVHCVNAAQDTLQHLDHVALLYGLKESEVDAYAKWEKAKDDLEKINTHLCKFNAAPLMSSHDSYAKVASSLDVLPFEFERYPLTKQTHRRSMQGAISPTSIKGFFRHGLTTAPASPAQTDVPTPPTSPTGPM